MSTHPATLAASTNSRSSVLENGVRIVTEQIDSVRSLSLGVLIDCGSAHERLGESGLAHLCEHLLFQGTNSRDSLQIARQIDESGGETGAFTTRDYTVYSATVLDRYSYHALDLLGDILLNSILPPESVEREKQVVLDEAAQLSDSPWRLAHDQLLATLWPDHPLGRPVSGLPEIVAGHERDDAIYFLHQNYTPDRVIVAAAGSLSHDDLVAQVRDAFWRMMGRSAPFSAPAPQARAGLSVRPAQSRHIYFSLGVPAPAYAAPGRYAVHALCRILGGGISSRLFRRIRESGLAYDIGAEYLAYRQAGVIVVSGACQASNFEETLTAVLEETEGLLGGARRIDEEELWRARNQICTQHLIASESAHTAMSRRATQELYFGGAVSSGEVISACEALTESGVARSASTLAGSLATSALSLAGGSMEESSVAGSLMYRFAWSAPCACT